MSLHSFFHPGVLVFELIIIIALALAISFYVLAALGAFIGHLMRRLPPSRFKTFVYHHILA